MTHGRDRDLDPDEPDEPEDSREWGFLDGLPACRRCSSHNVAWILHGYPAFSERLDRELDAGRVALGGCIVWHEQADYRCNDCAFEFQKDGQPGKPDPIHDVFPDDWQRRWPFRRVH